MSDGAFRVMVGVLAPDNLCRYDEVANFSDDFHFEAPVLCNQRKVLGYEVFNEEYGDPNEPIAFDELSNHHAVRSAQQTWEAFANYAGGKGVEVGNGRIFLCPD